MNMKRGYESPLRIARKGDTRRKILAALTAAMATGDVESISMESIAVAAGVSPATLFRHFANRDALFDGLWQQFDHEFGDLPFPATLDDLSRLARLSFSAFDDNPSLVDAFLATPLGRSARSRGRPKRIEAVRRSLRPVTANVSETDGQAAVAIIAHLTSIQTWKTLREEFGMSGRDVGNAVAWAIELVIDALVAHQSTPSTTAQSPKEDPMQQIMSSVRSVQSGSGHAVWIGPSRVTFKVTGDQSDGRYALFETLDLPQAAPPMHLHTREEESYYVLEGDYEIHLADSPVQRVGVGDFVTMPRGTAHTYKCISAQPGKMIVLASPAGLEHFFSALGVADPGNGYPPAMEGPPDFEAMARIAAEFGIEIVGPPPM